jgi:hypothetical protein
LSAGFDTAIRDSIGGRERLEVNVLGCEHDGLKVCGIRGRFDGKALKDSPAVVVADNDLNRTRDQCEGTRVVDGREITENESRDTGWRIVATRCRGNPLSGGNRSVNSGKTTVGVNPNRLSRQYRVGNADDGGGPEYQPIVRPSGVPHQSNNHLARHGLTLNLHFSSSEGGAFGVTVGDAAVNVRSGFR